MDKITIKTAQNVSIEYEIGSLGDRIMATIIDIAILIGYYIFISCLSAIIGESMSDKFYGVASVFLIIVITPSLFYPLLCETFMNGQSFGKRIRKIKVIRMDGRQTTFGNYLVRWLIGLIEITFYGIIAIITIVINGKGQRLGDIAAGTAVIKLKEREDINQTAFEKVNENYVPVFQQVALLSDEDATTIKQVLQLKDVENEVIIKDKLATRIKKVLMISSDLDNNAFLKTILRDFNKINGRL